MFNLIQSDLYKLGRSKTIKILFLIMCISAVVVTIVSYLVTQGKVGTEVSGSISLLTDIIMMSIIGPFLAGVYICGDFENKSIHDAISSCGCSRITVIISKAFVYHLLVMIMMIPYGVVTIIAFASGKAFCTPIVASVYLGILANQLGLGLTASVLVKMVVIILTMMIVYASQLTICILISFLLRKQALVIGLGIGLTMFLQITGGVGVKLKVLGDFLSYTPFSIGYKVLTMDAGADVIIKAIGISLLFIVWMLSITNGAFRKSEIN